MTHSTSFEPIDGKYVARCSAGDLSKAYATRNMAFLACHLHVLKVGTEHLNLASAGKADHD